MTINFINGEVVQAASVYLNQDHLCILQEDASAGQYKLDHIKEIILPRPAVKVPTVLQTTFMTYLDLRWGYRYDKQHSISAAGVVLKRVSDGDFWFFGLEGEIMHNPKALLAIKL